MSVHIRIQYAVTYPVFTNALRAGEQWYREETRCGAFTHRNKVLAGSTASPGNTPLNGRSQTREYMPCDSALRSLQTGVGVCAEVRMVAALWGGETEKGVREPLRVENVSWSGCWA